MVGRVVFVLLSNVLPLRLPPQQEQPCCHQHLHVGDMGATEEGNFNSNISCAPHLNASLHQYCIIKQQLCFANIWNFKFKRELLIQRPLSHQRNEDISFKNHHRHHNAFKFKLCRSSSKGKKKEKWIYLFQLAPLQEAKQTSKWLFTLVMNKQKPNVMYNKCKKFARQPPWFGLSAKTCRRIVVVKLCFLTTQHASCGIPGSNSGTSHFLCYTQIRNSMGQGKIW